MIRIFYNRNTDTITFSSGQYVHNNLDVILVKPDSGVDKLREKKLSNSEIIELIRFLAQNLEANHD